jgi:putative aldouronate transport system permease protein
VKTAHCFLITIFVASGSDVLEVKMKRKSIGDNIFDTCNYLFMFFIMIIMLYPLVHVIAISLSDASAIAAGKVTWFPRGFNINGYLIMLRNNDLLIGYKNTILYAIAGTFLTLCITSLVAYSLATKNFVFKRFLTVFFVITMFFNGGIIPTYLLIRNLGLLNTFWVMVIPTCVTAYNVIVFRTFFEGIPTELKESAFIDGANDLVIWYKIIIPLSKPLLATFALFTIVFHWNSWFSALLYLRETAKYPLQMALRKLVIIEDITGGAHSDSEIATMMEMMNVDPKNIQMAAVLIAMGPILLVYPYIQKYFVKGVMVGSVKG